jgi:hypothetical protein
MKQGYGKNKLCIWKVRVWGCIQKFPDWVVTKYTLTTTNSRWEATQRVMAAKLTRLSHKIAIQLHLVAESCTICSSRSVQAASPETFGYTLVYSTLAVQSYAWYLLCTEKVKVVIVTVNYVSIITCNLLRCVWRIPKLDLHKSLLLTGNVCTFKYLLPTLLVQLRKCRIFDEFFICCGNGDLRHERFCKGDSDLVSVA